LFGFVVVIPGYHSVGAPDTKLLFPGFQIGIREGANLVYETKNVEIISTLHIVCIFMSREVF
jgi:hypothetical protein